MVLVRRRITSDWARNGATKREWRTREPGGSARRVDKGRRVYGAGRDVVERDGGYVGVYGRLLWGGE